MSRNVSKWRFLLFAVLASGTVFATPLSSLSHTGRAVPEADRIFRQEPRWLGADAALSIPLSENRILWLFGDTFVATSDTHLRSESEMIRNTVAIQKGKDPRTASIKFYWREDDDALPASFFPEQGKQWYWPGHGVRLEKGPLIIFLYRMVATPGQDLGYSAIGYAVAIVHNPDQPADRWNLEVFDVAPSGFDAIPATAALRDGAHVVALAIRQAGTHAGALVRFPVKALSKGDVSSAEWWAGDERGWVAEAALGDGGPAFVLEDAGSECSVHWDARTGSFVHVASYGFGASTIGVRTAPQLTGPWSSPITVYRPPESDDPSPFVYAAKAHPELIGPDASDLLITYATNSFELADLLTELGTQSLYWPRFVAVPIGDWRAD